MKSLFIKEMSGFFSSLTGYVIIVVFLLVNGLFLWVFPGERNVLDAGYATLDTAFIIAPWVFLFLIPAVTMRSLADEKKTGNLDLLLTRPLSDMQIVLAKYLASLTVAFFAMLPTLIFFLSVYLLGIENMRIDTGATWGSYIGLVFLAASYVSIGLFASSFTDNIIIAFILSVLLCFFFYIGFDSIGYLSQTGKAGNLIISLGIDAHYQSMQRGVIDSRDVVYFLSVIVIFLFFTRTKVHSRTW
jgi:ABC-2 type transport system permease protein